MFRQDAVDGRGRPMPPITRRLTEQIPVRVFNAFGSGNDIGIAQGHAHRWPGCGRRARRNRRNRHRQAPRRSNRRQNLFSSSALYCLMQMSVIITDSSQHAKHCGTRLQRALPDNDPTHRHVRQCPLVSQESPPCAINSAVDPRHVTRTKMRHTEISSLSTPSFVDPLYHRSKRKASPSFSHCALFRVDAAWPRLGRAFRTAPVSRQTNPNPVWHSPRFHSRPATLLRSPFCPFRRSRLVSSRCRSSEGRNKPETAEREKT